MQPGADACLRTDFLCGCGVFHTKNRRYFSDAEEVLFNDALGKVRENVGGTISDVDRKIARYEEGSETCEDKQNDVGKRRQGIYDTDS